MQPHSAGSDDGQPWTAPGLVDSRIPIPIPIPISRSVSAGEPVGVVQPYSNACALQIPLTDRLCPVSPK